MDVDVEHAGKHVVAGGVGDPCPRGRVKVGAQRHDLLIGDAYVADEAPARGDDVAPPDDPVQAHRSDLRGVALGLVP
ncbi:hypothetical protein D3C83_65490 [compost metagenome]